MDLLSTIARNVAGLVTAFTFRDAVVMLRLSKCHIELLEQKLVTMRHLVWKDGLIGVNALFPKSSEHFEWYHGETTSSPVPPDLPDPTWMMSKLAKFDHDHDHEIKSGLSHLLLHLEMQTRILHGDKNLVVLTQDEFDDIHRKATKLKTIEYFSVLRRIMTHVHRIDGSLHRAQGFIGLKIACMSGDTSLLKAILINTFADCTLGRRIGLSIEMCARRLQFEISSRAQDQSLLGWKEVFIGDKQWPISGIRTPSFLILMVRHPLYDGRTWFEYLNLVAHTGNPQDLYHTWLCWTEIYQGTQYSFVKKLRAWLLRVSPLKLPVILERELQYQTRQRLPMAQALTERTCNQLACQGASHEAWKIATYADQSLVSRLDHSTYEALLDHGRFDMGQGPSEIWRIFQKQIENYEAELGIRWIPDGVTGKHTLEGEWADFDYILQEGNGLNEQGSVGTGQSQTEVSNEE